MHHVCHVEGLALQRRVEAGRRFEQGPAVPLVPLRARWLAREAEPKDGDEDVGDECEEEEIAEPAPCFRRTIGKTADEERQGDLDEGHGDIENKFVHGSVVEECVVVFVSMLPLFEMR